MARYSLIIYPSFGGGYLRSLKHSESAPERARSQRLEDRIVMLVHVNELLQSEADIVLAAYELAMRPIMGAAAHTSAPLYRLLSFRVSVSDSLTNGIS
ncbi:hypothetical protein [Mesorhizobium sp. M0040]|uniref:hypothetical protein n=1 Tax=Mesorhizobium sp. M0040 TaxID=2956855 RepID=UPI003335E951